MNPTPRQRENKPQPISPPDFSCAVGIVQEIERRYLSSLWREPIAAFNAAVDCGLSGETFTSDDLAAVYGTLAARAEAFAESGRLWPIGIVRDTLATLGVELVAGDNGDELARILECETSGAGCGSYAQLLAYYKKKRVQVGRLWRALSAIPDDIVNAGTMPARQRVLVRSIRHARPRRGAA